MFFCFVLSSGGENAKLTDYTDLARGFTALLTDEEADALSGKK